MAWPATQQTQRSGLERANVLALNNRNNVQRLHDDSVAGPVERNRVIGTMGMLDEAAREWAQIAAIPGIGDYSREQYDDLGLDIAIEFAAMVAAAETLRDWVFANFPTDASGPWLVDSYTIAGTRIAGTFTSAQLAGFRTEAVSFLATIA